MSYFQEKSPQSSQDPVLVLRQPTSFRGVSNRAGGYGSTGKKVEEIKVAGNESFFLGATPSFDLIFRFSGFFSRCKFLSPNKFHRQTIASPRGTFAVFSHQSPDPCQVAGKLIA